MMLRCGVFSIFFLFSSLALAAIKNTTAPVSESSYGDCVVRHTIYAREYKPEENAKKYFSHNPVGFIKDECANAGRIALGFKGARVFLDKISGEVPHNNMSGSGFLCSPGETDEYGCIRKGKNKTKDIAGTVLKYKNSDYLVSITIGKIIASNKLALDETMICVEHWREAKITVSDMKNTWHIPGTISGGACP
jgi:hypothetical protein